MTNSAANSWLTENSKTVTQKLSQSNSRTLKDQRCYQLGWRHWTLADGKQL